MAAPAPEGVAHPANSSRDSRTGPRQRVRPRLRRRPLLCHGDSCPPGPAPNHFRRALRSRGGSSGPVRRGVPALWSNAATTQRTRVPHWPRRDHDLRRGTQGHPKRQGAADGSSAVVTHPLHLLTCDQGPAAGRPAPTWDSVPADSPLIVQSPFAVGQTEAQWGSCVRESPTVTAVFAVGAGDGNRTELSAWESDMGPRSVLAGRI
jgi:hypothetical protein